MLHQDKGNLFFRGRGTSWWRSSREIQRVERTDGQNLSLVFFNGFTATIIQYSVQSIVREALKYKTRHCPHQLSPNLPDSQITQKWTLDTTIWMLCLKVGLFRTPYTTQYLPVPRITFVWRRQVRFPDPPVSQQGNLNGNLGHFLLLKKRIMSTTGCLF